MISIIIIRVVVWDISCGGGGGGAVSITFLHAVFYVAIQSARKQP